MASMQIRTLEQADWESYRTIRLEALAGAPEAFGTSLAEEERMAPEDWQRRLAPGSERVMFGAFLGGQIVGTVGLIREQRAKTCHKGMIVGMYVSPVARGRGVGRLLLQEALQRARAMDGLEQVELAVVSDNHAARQLYLSMGFALYGREPRALRVDGRYYDEDLMVIML